MLRARPLIALLDGRVVCGNQRLLAARELGWVSIPTVFVDLDDARARTWVLRDNNGYGEWDDSLAGFLSDLRADGVELELTGFSPEFVEGLLRPLDLAGRDPDEAPAAPARPKSVLGGLYELGRHRLVCGDATDPEVLLAVAAGVRAGVVWTDPPYGVGYVGKTGRALRIANDAPAETAGLLVGAFVASASVLEPGSPFYLASPAGPMGVVFRAALAEAGWRLHQSLVWVKDAFVLGHSDYHYRHEDILYGYLPGGGRPGRGRHRGSRWLGDNRSDTVFEVPRPARSSEHPTMKPVELIMRQLTNSLAAGGSVLDPFAGSGSTLIAAERLGGRCLAVELDPGYCDVIRSRYAAYSGQPGCAP